MDCDNLNSPYRKVIFTVLFFVICTADCKISSADYIINSADYTISSADYKKQYGENSFSEGVFHFSGEITLKM